MNPELPKALTSYQVAFPLENSENRIVLGIQGTENKMLGMHDRVINVINPLYMINEKWAVPSNQLVWTVEGWSCAQPMSYRLLRYESAEYLPKMQSFLQCVIDADKLAPLKVGTKLALLNGETVEVSSLEKLDSAISSWPVPVVDGNHSYSLEGGLVVDGCLGILMPEANLKFVE